MKSLCKMPGHQNPSVPPTTRAARDRAAVPWSKPRNLEHRSTADGHNLKPRVGKTKTAGPNNKPSVLVVFLVVELKSWMCRSLKQKMVDLFSAANQ